MLLATLLLTAPFAGAVEIVDAVFRQYENGPEQDARHEYRGGDVVWFDCRVQGYARTEETDPRFALTWNAGVIDARRQAVTRAKQGKLSGELTDEDKAYRPRIRFDVALPPLLLPGRYVIGVAVDDEIDKTKKTATFEIKVGGRAMEIPKELTAAQLRFLRQEDDRRPLDAATYRPGDPVWLRFEIMGFRHGESNKIDVEYGLLVLGPSGQPFLRQDPASGHTAESYYPQFYVPASVRIELPPKATAGEYIVVLSLRDKVSGQSAAARTSFTVE